MASTQRVAIVTGASHGIGAGLVAGYRGLGFRVVATSRSITPSTDELVLAIPGDIRDRATAKKVVAAAKERFGRVDTLVNNAGIFVSSARDRGCQERSAGQCCCARLDQDADARTVYVRLSRQAAAPRTHG
jgi:NAD(P)-dependent dehydrogenase (short-subunit alcohol dehydrogenase family)